VVLSDLLNKKIFKPDTKITIGFISLPGNQTKISLEGFLKVYDGKSVFTKITSLVLFGKGINTV
jgi:hypothetical protein